MNLASTNRPHEELQESILGCLLAFPEEVKGVAGVLDSEDFLSPKYRTAFQYLIEQDGQADLVKATVGLSGVVKSCELSEWICREFSSAFLPTYCRELKELSTKAKIWRMTDELRAGFREMSSAELQELAEKRLASFAGQVQTEAAGLKSLLAPAMKNMEHRYNNRGKEVAIPYGIGEVDRLTGGLHRGDLVIVAGRPSMGKSALLTNILQNAGDAGCKSLLFSLEMGNDQTVDRLIASTGRVGLHRIRSGNFHDGDWMRMQAACGTLSGLPIMLDDSCDVGLKEIKSRARKAKRHGLDIVAVDYLQLMRTKGDNRVREIGEISRGLKLLARELDVAVIALSQLSRGLESRTDKRPVMSDLRDSGEIEQDADVIIFPFRQAAYCAQCKDRVETPEHSTKIHESQAEIIIEKQRNGPRNVSVKVAWVGEFQRFEEV